MTNEEKVVKVQECCEGKGNKVSKEDAESYVKFVELGKQNKLEGNDQKIYDFLSGKKGELTEEELGLVAGGADITILDVFSTPFRGIITVIGAAGLGVFGAPIQGGISAYYGTNWCDDMKALWDSMWDSIWGIFED